MPYFCEETKGIHVLSKDSRYDNLTDFALWFRALLQLCDLIDGSSDFTRNNKKYIVKGGQTAQSKERVP